MLLRFDAGIAAAGPGLGLRGHGHAGPCGSDEERRVFDAVVRPRQAGRPTADADAERDRLRKEIARAEGMLANERFVSGAPPHVVEAEREKLARYRRELDALGG